MTNQLFGKLTARIVIVDIAPTTDPPPTTPLSANHSTEKEREWHTQPHSTVLTDGRSGRGAEGGLTDRGRARTQGGRRSESPRVTTLGRHLVTAPPSMRFEPSPGGSSMVAQPSLAKNRTPERHGSRKYIWSITAQLNREEVRLHQSSLSGKLMRKESSNPTMTPKW